MKRRIVHLWPLFVFPLFTILYQSCNKSAELSPVGANSEDQKLFLEAKASFFSGYYDQDLYPQATDSLLHPTRHLKKVPDWNAGNVAMFSFGKGVVVPVTVLDALSFYYGGTLRPVNECKMTWLFMYRDGSMRWHGEVITKIPAFGHYNNDPFNGEVRVEDWEGKFIEGYLYSPGGALVLATSRIYKRETPVERGRVTPFMMAPIGPVTQTCTETDWYACATVGNGPTECTYAYTTEECSASIGGAALTASAPGAPTAGDYQQVGGGSGGVGSYLTTTVASITPDTSIINHPIVACVYNHLMSATLKYGLKNILSSFDDNEKYNISFMVTSMANVSGITTYKGNNTFVVKLNAEDADDPDYSRIYLASTFIHEAFHAKLRQKALETFGELPISQ